MNIGRAHSYSSVEHCLSLVDRLPLQWQEDIGYLTWHIYPVDLSPLFTGLQKTEVDTGDGRLFSEVGGWFAEEEHNWLISGDLPCIFLKEDHVGYSTFHEIGHALSRAWHVDEEHFYKPDSALFEYMSSDPSEYFACAFDLFWRPHTWDGGLNEYDLAKRDPELYAFFVFQQGLT